MRQRLGWVLAATLFAGLAAPVAGHAQDEGEEIDAAEERAMTMEAAEPGAQTENIPGGMLLVAAYGVVWILVFGYVGWLGLRQARLASELERLKGDLAKAERREG